MIAYIMKCEMNLLIHFQTSAVQPLKLSWACDNLSMLGLKLTHGKRGSWGLDGCRNVRLITLTS